jgi:hypothetical protein
MDQNLSNEDREKKFYEARVKENEDKIAKEFKRIFDKRHQGVTIDEKRFLQARRDYLTRAEQEEYKEELTEDLTGGTFTNPLENLTRKELEARLQAVGVQDTSNKVYRTNADLISAIEELSA